MTTYATIADSDLDPESPGTTTLFTRLRDNPIAITEGASGAPKIQTAAIADDAVTAAKIAADAVGQSEIAANAVGQSELKHAVSNQSTSVPSEGAAGITPTGGDWTHNWFVDGPTSGSYVSLHTGETNAGDTSPNSVRFYNSSSVGSQSAYLRSSYHQASPPWNNGYGDIAQFIMVMLDRTTQEVLGTYSAPDPAWAYHGPHDIHPVIGAVKKEVGLWGVNIKQAFILDPAGTTEKLRQMKAALKQPQILKNIRRRNAFSMEEKNADMDIVPHLFDGYDPTKHVVCLLDPCSDLTDSIALAEEFAGPDMALTKLLHEGYIQIDNTPLPVSRTPAGVLTVGYSWKNAMGAK